MTRPIGYARPPWSPGGHLLRGARNSTGWATGRGTGVDPLTSREREVALLAADGLATKEIATRLYLSKRTIDTHLDRIYRKLGISGRDELPEALGSTGNSTIHT